jgi:O-antigen biosynthesis protein
VPIRVSAGALGRLLPRRDLILSPMHALFIDPVLVPAGLLVNGISVLRCPETKPITHYLHVELESHDVIFAEGQPVETYIDCDNRMLFQNVAEFTALYPNDTTPAWRFCAPRVESSANLRRIRRQIAALAGIGDDVPGQEKIPPPGETVTKLDGHLDRADAQEISGWAWAPGQSEVPVELEILDGDGVIARVVADRFSQELQQRGIGDGRHRFELRLSPPLPPWRPYELHARRTGDRAELPGSPVIIPPLTGLALLQDATFGAAVEEAVRGARSVHELDAVLQVFLSEAERVLRLRARHLATPQSASAGDARMEAAACAARPSGGNPGRLVGHLDVARNDHDAGWAFDAGRPGERIELEVLDGETLLGRVIACEIRPDLRKAGQGDGCSGYRLDFPVPLAPWRRHEVHVRRRSDEAALEGSPVLPPAVSDETMLDAGRLSLVVEALGGQVAADAELPALAAALEERTELVQRLVQDRRRVEAARPTRRDRTRRALIVDEKLPAGGHDSAVAPLLGHMLALSRLGYRLEFVAWGAMAAQPIPLEQFPGLDVICHQAPAMHSVEEVLRRSENGYAVIYLHRLESAAAYAGLARRWCPGARLLFSVADLRHLRLARQAKVQGKPEVLAGARSVKQLELLAMRLADAVLTHSTAEARYLATEAPGARIHVVPWPLHPASAPAFDARSGVAFIGDPAHPPDSDALIWLMQEVMPLAWERQPAIPCRIFGPNWPEVLVRDADPRLRPAGPEVPPGAALATCRLTVAPLRFGAGLKPRVLESLAAGVPCAMSRTAAEGMALPPSLRRLVAADAEELAWLICRLHEDSAANAEAAAAGLALVRTQFNLRNTTRRLQQALAEPPAAPVVALAR